MSDASREQQLEAIRNALVLAWPDPMLRRIADDGTLWAEAIAETALTALEQASTHA